MYSLTRFWMGLNDARMLIQVSVVVSTTRTIESPSTPTVYWMPNIGIQSTRSTNWKPGGPRDEARQHAQRDDPGGQREAQRRVARDVGPAARRHGDHDARRASGRNVTSGARGRSSRLAHDHQERARHHEQPDRDAQRVVLDATGLDPPQPAARAAGQQADAVDGAVDDRPVEPPQGGGDAPADPDEQQVVELVEPPLVERGPVEEPRRRRWRPRWRPRVPAGPAVGRLRTGRCRRPGP